MVVLYIAICRSQRRQAAVEDRCMLLGQPGRGAVGNPKEGLRCLVSLIFLWISKLNYWQLYV